MKTVNEMYKNTTLRNKALLSNYGSDFWAEYVLNFAEYDKVFRRMFLSYFYFLQEGDEDISDLTDEFIDAVKGHLLVNDKKYSELYRINVIDDDSYSLLNNYDLTESKTVTHIGGSTDTNVTEEVVNEYGTQTVNSQSSPYDTTSFVNAGSTVAQTYSDTLNKDGNTNTVTNSNNYNDSESVRRFGNIGVQTADDIIMKHNQNWTSFEFYTLIFKDICRELLMIS